MPVLDASLVVSWSVHLDSNFLLARRWVNASIARGDRWNVPSILLTEVAAALARSESASDAALKFAQTFPLLEQVSLFPVDRSLAAAAAEIAAELKIRGCDAIYVALAAELGDALVTFDSQQLDRAREMVTVVQPE